MKMILAFACLLVAVECIPMNYQLLDNGVLIRSRRSPNHAMLFTGYYGQQQPLEQHPHLNGPNEECQNCGDLGLNPALIPNEELPVETTPQIQEYPLLPQAPMDKIPEESTIEESTVPKDTKPTKKEESEEEDEAESWPFPQNGKRTRPLFNFFPIMFGGYAGRSSGGVPSGATAIANSFSTGKGGVATSHATAYGDPSEFLRNANFNRNGQ